MALFSPRLMNIKESRSEILFTSSGGDWLFRVSISADDKLTLELRSNVGGFELSDGLNYENLGPFIAAVKAEVLARNLTWSES